MILLSFDIEEFDMPFEYGKSISFADQISISTEGTTIILDLLKKYSVKATFFSTVTFAKNAPEIIDRIVNEGHELASHTVNHSSFKDVDYLDSLVQLQELSGLPITGFRMPRMQPVNDNKLREAGYLYDSSINPTYLPGRYNNLKEPRKFHYKNGIIKLPASVSTFFRFPLFWLSFHNLPNWLYFWLSKKAIKSEGYLNIYFHPWEFYNLKDKKRFGFPTYVSKNSGNKMVLKMEDMLNRFSKKGYQFSTISNYILPIFKNKKA
ncbi:polysaccharide deacetylase [Pedobacter psychrophilus]|uniref:Polysaccharide deacetylase n=1 Tax=Pedobacter psychrophilus TaxID=1826909 RepID=A0A179DF06_9SPHI|nr:polysaccharide deacetylase family protein [Pedobacter psychrophilus]OAQ39627.1 polysaccharide deacetylase [Pedobacter psychrophilus]